MEDMQQMEADIKEGGLDVASPEQAAEITPKVEALFKEAYKVMYEDEKFDVLVDQIRETGEIVLPVTQFLVAILSAIIEQGGVTDIDVLGNLGLLLLGDVMMSLNEVGIDTESLPVEDMKQILQGTITGVMNANPEFADMVVADPRTQEFMQKAPGPKGPMSPQGQGEGQQVGPGSGTRQGVMGSTAAQEMV